VLQAIFARIGTANKWCCEFGALDGEAGSNTYDLNHNHGWHGILIEGDGVRYQRLVKAAPQIGDVVPIHAFVGTEGANALDNLLAGCSAPIDIDLISIDIDNDDYFVCDALKTYRPRVVVIEVNSQWPVHVDKIPVPGYHRSTYHTGASIKSMVNLAKAKGYELAIHTANAIFVRRDLAPQLDIDPDHWEELFDPSWVNRPFRKKLNERTRDLLRLALGKRYTAVGSVVKNLRKK
jgi:hypothetical protein